MSFDKNEPTTATWPERVQTGETMLNEGETFHAVQHFAQLIVEAPEDPEIHRHASRALVTSIENGSISGVWDEDRRQTFYLTLILQNDCQRQPPFLHEAVVNAGTSSSSALASKVSAVLSPTLREIYSKDLVNKNFVMLVLILRDVIHGWIDQQQISKYHLDWLTRFTIDDMSLLYNTMFTVKRRNSTLRDVSDFLINSVDPAGFNKNIPIFQLALFEWLFGTDNKLDTEALISFVLQAAETEAPTGNSIAAAKSLVARHANQPLARFESPRLESAFDARFRDFVALCVKDRASLRIDQKTARIRVSSYFFEKSGWQGYQAVKSTIGQVVAPFVKRRGRRLKVAVCISGQLRGYKTAFRTWQQHLLPAVDHDLFVHTWSKIGRSGAEPFRYVLPFASPAFSIAYKENANLVGFEEFQRRYPAFFRGLFETGSIRQTDIAKFYRSEQVVLDNESSAPFDSMTNQDKMHYKIQSGFEMACRSPAEYDLVIRIRPDKPIRLRAFDWSALYDICRTSNTIFADHATGLHYSMLMIGDQFAVGTPLTMAVYSRAWELYPPMAASGLLKCSPQFEGHATLAQVCWAHGIEVKRIPMSFGKLQDAESLQPSQILAYLNEDAAGRMNDMDTSLISAAAKDLQLVG